MNERPQLRMVWPRRRLGDRPDPRTDGRYEIRTHMPGDDARFLALMAQLDFGAWGRDRLDYSAARVIPGGWFFAIEREEGSVVGTAMSLHNYCGDAPFVGDVGWLAVLPGHRRSGLGYSLTAHVTNRFLDAGYEHLRLHTEEYRLPAILTYLRLGYLPVMYREESSRQWRDACAHIEWAYEPEVWAQSAG